MRLLPKRWRALGQRIRSRSATENARALAEYLEIRPHLQGVPYLIAAVVVGFAAVLYSTAFSNAVRVAQSVSRAHPFLFVLAAPLFFALSVWLVRRFAPQAGGSGLPQVMHALDVVDEGSMGVQINLRVAAVTVASSLVALLGGSGLGREGPMILIAACLFYAVGNQFRRLWPAADHRSWLVAGGAAGLAAAFQTPLAGVIFVLEELAHMHYRDFKTYVISAVVVAGMIAQWLYGRYLFLGYAKVGQVPATMVLWAALVGALCGFVGAYFESIRDWALKKLRPFRKVSPVRVAAVMGLFVGIIVAFEPRGVGGGIATLEELLFTEGARAPWYLPLVRFATPLLSHLSGAAGGFLAPSLSLGASLGSVFTYVAAFEHHNLMVMSGMVAFLAASSRAPFTALVVVMEMTDSHSAIFPLMIAAVSGYGVISLIRRKAA